ncbi:MAG: hypothetical protein ACD_29C00259G0001 [uncultured bacterium]|nr:MAG: hypothetical protein ACD_29C00259G0001 [uncultured bacterium]
MIAGTSCAALIIFLFFSNTAQWIYLSHQENNLNNQVSLAYQKIFPGSKHILEPHFRVSNLLSRLEKESSGGTFLHLLAMSGKALAQYSTIKIQSIQFSDGKLSIMVQTNQVLQLNALLSSLNQAGLLVQQHSQKIGKTTVNATLIIREQA